LALSLSHMGPGSTRALSPMENISQTWAAHSEVDALSFLEATYNTNIVLVQRALVRCGAFFSF
jgi:hypothetical protein